MNHTKKRLAIIKLAISMTDTETIQLQILKLGLIKTDDKMQEIIQALNIQNYAKAQKLISSYIESPIPTTIVQRAAQEKITPEPSVKTNIKEEKIKDGTKINGLSTISLDQVPLIKEKISIYDNTEDREDYSINMEEIPLELKDIEIKEVQTEETLELPEASLLEKKSNPIKNEMNLSLQEKIQEAKDKTIIEEFELFTENTEENDIKEEAEPNYNDFIEKPAESKKISIESINYDSLLNVTSEDVLTDNIELDISEISSDIYSDEEAALISKIEDSNDFFTIDAEKKQMNKHAASHLTIAEERTQDSFDEVIPKEIQSKENTSLNILNSQENELASVNSTNNTTEIDTEDNKVSSYKAISYIDQKFKNMLNQYPPVEESNESFTLVDTLLIQISKYGYSEEEIEKTIQKTEKLTHTNKAEAAQLLLIIAATESKYAQFRLARALFKGDILQKNLPEAFTLINRLAMNDDYPEAICDLAQFYENGIGIGKDKKKAEVLYKEAMNLGINRATNHYQRIQKENKGLLSRFLK